MPLVAGSRSELLKEGYHRLRNPERSESLAQAYEARLQELRERKVPPMPTWREVWDSLREAWKEAGAVWEADRANRTASQGKDSTTRP
jgi:hypothetical protein